MLLGLLALQASAIAVGGALEATACKPCHEQTVATFLQTAHVVSSAEATARSIKGRFAAGHNVLRTRSPGVSFRMEERNGAFYETGVDSARGRAITRRIELVVGSGRRGQSYLYWSGGLRSRTDRASGSTTISSPGRARTFPFRTSMVIRWDCCGAASAFARARTCPVRRATTSIDPNETSRCWLRSVWRAIRRANIRGRPRSEERRVGKECRSRWSPYHEKKKSRESAPEPQRNRATNKYRATTKNANRG